LVQELAALHDGRAEAAVFCAVIDPATENVRYSSAGHLPALIAEPNGTGHRLEHARCVPLAVRNSRERLETTTAIPSGSAMLLYSDGLVERRDEVIDAGIDRAAAALAGSLPLASHAAVDHIYASLLTNGHHEDDVALLVYRRP
jgi:serine phosphatase RsbU (regulator of sigma subunit)